MFRLRITGNLGFEFWQDIPEYEGLYQASTYGRIRNKKNISAVNYHINCKWGYCQLHLWINGNSYSKRVHRLIAETFIPNPNKYREINHIDENKLNNRVENLEWCTHKYNCAYGTRNQRIGLKNTKQKS